MLDSKIVAVLKELLGKNAVLFHSLNFERGSGQPVHVDSWFMPPPPNGELIAVWICLEDVEKDAGPLVYIPGSHKLEKYIFSNGSEFHIPEEVPKAVEDLGVRANKNGMNLKQFLAKKGDVFVWHQQLAHGGAY